MSFFHWQMIMTLRGDWVTKGDFVLGVMGVDPAKRSGYGLVAKGSTGPARVLSHGMCEGDGAAIGLALDAMLADAAQAGLDDVVLVCEAQFVKDTRSMDPAKRRGQQRGALSVAAHRGRWLGLAEERKVATSDDTHPTIWRGAVLGRGWGRKPRAQAKAQAVAVVAGLWGIRLVKSHHDVAEALLIASYGATELYQARRALALARHKEKHGR